MLSNATEIYAAFLEGIRKQRTSSVQPEVFCNLWNIWGLMKWLNSLPYMQEGAEISEKEINDFAMIRSRIVVSPSSANTYTLPDGTSNVNIDEVDQVTVTDDDNPIVLAFAKKYKRALTIMFKLDYDSNTSQACSLTGVSDFLMSKYLRSDNEGITLSNSYLKPSDDRLYYQRVKNNVIFVKKFSTQSDSVKMYLDYFHYPNWMTYSNGAFSYTLEFAEEQVAKVLEIVISSYLERQKDPRWQTHLQNESLLAGMK